jgi:transcriptional regulator with XRE-family HTH domain
MADNEDRDAAVDDRAITEEIARIGPRIVESRNRRGWSQRELGRRVGVRPARLSRLERAAKPPKLDELIRIARALDVGLDQLVFGETPRPRMLELVRELETLGTPEEISGLGRLLQLVLVGYRKAGGGSC